MGRKKLTQQNPEFLQILVQEYMRTGSQKKAAHRAGCSIRSARTYLHQQGIFPKRGRQKGRFYSKAYKGRFAQWLKENPTVELAGKTPPQIAQLSGCSAKDIREYFYRVEKAIQREVKTLPDLRKLNGSLKDLRGKLIPFKAISSYKIKTSGYRREILVEAKLKTSLTVLFKIHLDALWGFIEKNIPSPESPHHQTG